MRLRLDIAGVAIHAVGDVHGCLDELLSLERAIVEDGKDVPARKLIIMIGEYADRAGIVAGPGTSDRPRPPGSNASASRETMKP